MKRIMRRGQRVFFQWALLVCFIANQPALGAVAPRAKPTPVPEKVLRVYQPQDIATLDWQNSTYEVDSAVLMNLQDGLLTISSDGKPAPSLSISYSTSEKGRLYRFRLNPKAKWSDGVPVTSQHFVDAWRRLLTASTAAPYAYLLFDIIRAEDYYNGKMSDFSKVGIYAPDPHTLEVELRRPQRGFLWAVSHRATFPVREDLLRLHGNLWTKPGHLVTTGPFMLTAREFGRGLTLKRNPHFVGQLGNVDRVDFVIRSKEELPTLIKKAEVDLVLKLPPALKTQFSDRSELKWFPPVRTKRLSFNVEKWPMSNPKLRQAIAHAIDRPRISAQLGTGYHTGTALVPAGFLGHSQEAGLKFSAVKARALLKKAVGSTAPPALRILVPTFDENAGENSKVAQLIEQSIEATLNIRVELELVDEASRWPLLARGKQYAMILHDWKADFPDADNFYSLYSSRSKHTIQWSDTAYDQFVESAREEVNTEKRRALYRKADELLLEQHTVMVPVYYASEGIFVGQQVGQFRFDPFNFYRLSEVTLK